MTLSFADASKALVSAAQKTNEFSAACAEQLQNLKDELAGTDSALRSVLAHQANLKLPNGLYLYMKESQSTRALNETRIAHAIESLNPAQCVELAREHKDWSPSQVLAEAIADNLYAECVVTNSAPALSKKIPTPDAVWRAAPANVVPHAQRFYDLQQKLAAMRKHRSAGKKRAASVQAVAEPVVQAYMEQQHVVQKVVQFGPVEEEEHSSDEDELYFPPFPEMPTLPVPVHVDTQASPLPAPVAVLDTQDHALRGKKVMFTARTYTSRGKAPKLNTFLNALPQALQTVVTQKDYAQIPQLKPGILDKLLNLFKSQFQASQGSVKKRLILKSIE